MELFAENRFVRSFSSIWAMALLTLSLLAPASELGVDRKPQEKSACFFTASVPPLDFVARPAPSFQLDELPPALSFSASNFACCRSEKLGILPRSGSPLLPLPASPPAPAYPRPPPALLKFVAAGRQPVHNAGTLLRGILQGFSCHLG